MSKKKKTLVITLGLLAMFAVCIVSVYFYAQYTINKPKYDIPDEEPFPSVTEIPESGIAKLDYIEKLFAGSFTDENEVTKRIDNWMEYDNFEANLSDADSAILKKNLNSAADRTEADFETYDSVAGDQVKAVPVLNLLPENSETEITQGTVNDNGETENEDYYYFTVTGAGEKEISASTAETFGTDNDISNIEKLIAGYSDYANITIENFEFAGSTVSGRIDRIADQIDYIDLIHKYSVTLSIDFEGDYAPLGTVNATFTYVVKTTYDFKWYGARFTEHAVYMNPKDSVTLPASAVVADSAEQSDFELTFTSSDESIVTVDSEGIATGIAASDKPATVTITLKYKGHTYTDTIDVIVTELEVD